MRADFVEGLATLADEDVRADALLMDLGMSSMQVDTRERGFSYAYDAPLDMRMDPTLELSAREVVNEWDERELSRALRDLGEERYARQIARAIVRARARGPIDTTMELVDVVTAAVPAPARFAGGHPAKRTFQAIRIAVNDELGQLDSALPLAWRVLGIGGRFAGISFHSLEDRRVKRFLVDLARGCTCPPDLPVCVCGGEPRAELLTRRSIVAGIGRGRREPAGRRPRGCAPPASSKEHRHEPTGDRRASRDARRPCAPARPLRPRSRPAARLRPGQDPSRRRDHCAGDPRRRGRPRPHAARLARARPAHPRARRGSRHRRRAHRHRLMQVHCSA